MEFYVSNSARMYFYENLVALKAIIDFFHLGVDLRGSEDDDGVFAHANYFGPMEPVYEKTQDMCNIMCELYGRTNVELVLNKVYVSRLREVLLRERYGFTWLGYSTIPLSVARICNFMYSGVFYLEAPNLHIESLFQEAF